MKIFNGSNVNDLGLIYDSSLEFKICCNINSCLVAVVSCSPLEEVEVYSNSPVNDLVSDSFSLSKLV